MVSLQDFQASEPFDTSSPRSGVTVSACRVDADPLTLLRWKTTGGTDSSLSPLCCIITEHGGILEIYDTRRDLVALFLCSVTEESLLRKRK